MPIEITMPRLSDTMETGTILKWNVSEGDAVSSGDVVADVETDKATMELSVFDDGTVAKILIAEGDSAEVGTLIALLAEDGEDVAEVAAAAAAKGDGAPRDESKDAADRAKERGRKDESKQRGAEDEEPDDEGPRRVSPVARRLAEEHDIDIASIRGSGPSGRIIKRDVLKAVEAAEETRASVPPSAKAKPHEGEEDREEPREVPATRVSTGESTELAVAGPMRARRLPLSNMRQTIARRLVESKSTIPHYQVTVTFAMDPLLELRKTLNEQLEPAGVKLSVNDFLVRCCAVAMHEHPNVNASWADEYIDVHEEVNIGIAIDVGQEKGGGLVVGVIRDADQKSLRAISAESRMLAEKARTRGLSIEEMSDSTFTISNLGMYGVEEFNAIINPPNSAILAVGAALLKPVVRDGELTIGHEMSATMSSDHRVIDGAMAAQYLATLKRYIENPATMMV